MIGTDMVWLQTRTKQVQMADEAGDERRYGYGYAVDYHMDVL